MKRSAIAAVMSKLGQSKSKAKIAAARRNIKRAIAKRWKKKR